MQYDATNAPIISGFKNGKSDVVFGPTLSLTYAPTHIAGTKSLGQVASRPEGFVTAKSPSVAPLLQKAVEVLIQNGDYAEIRRRWNAAAGGMTSSTFNPSQTSRDELTLTRCHVAWADPHTARVGHT